MKKQSSSSEIIKPQNFEERVIWYGLLGTYAFYLLGAQPIVFPVMAWVLLFYLFKKLWNQNVDTPEEEKIKIPIIAWIWVAFISLMVIALITSHIDFSAGLGRLIKSLIKWGKEWALWAIFPLVACLNIRPRLLYRGVCIMGLQSLVVSGFCYLAYLARLPSGKLYTVPFYLIGGGSKDFYTVLLYFFDEESGQPRLALFAPWAPNLATIGIIYFFLARLETHKKWRMIGTIGSLVMVFGSLSRMAFISLPLVIIITWILTNFDRPILYFTAGSGSFLTGIFASTLMSSGKDFITRMNQSRASSSKLRFDLVKLSLTKWWEEARIWGHGFTPERGTPYTFFYPIGTSGCGTWVNVLYTKGLVGLVAIAVPLLCTFLILTYKAKKNETARVALKILLVFLFFSLSEELDILSYVNWPGMLIIGLALKEEEPNYGDNQSPKIFPEFNKKIYDYVSLP